MVKRDSNQKEIVKALRQAGCSVADLSVVGNGCPDILVGYKRQNYLMEIKTKTGKINPLQSEFSVLWRGYPVIIVRSAKEALQAIGINA